MTRDITLSRKVKLDIYSYCQTSFILSTISCLSHSERECLKGSYIANKDRSLSLTLKMEDYRLSWDD